jgi:hypothetical protein
MTVRNTIPIVFNGGSYGTYLEWVLTALTSADSIQEPFTATGSSHKFKGNHLKNMTGWKKFINDRSSYQFVRLHPKTEKHESLSENLNTMLDSVDRAIYLYPDLDSVLLVLNNYFEKIWDDWWNHQFEKEISQDNIYKNWPVDSTVDIKNIPPWIKREFLSLYLMPSWHDQVEWYHLDTWHHDRALPILVKDLLYDFENTLQRIKQFCDIEFTRSISQIMPYHEHMLSIQAHRHQTQLANQIIQATVAGTNLDWQSNSITLVTESWIQWQLRNLGFEIQCHELDIFPTNSLKLKNLLYKV